jgi:RNA polymerase sigma-70 factor (ECF subfamily)
MANSSTTESAEIGALLQQAAAGDQVIWGRLLSRYRERLRSMVSLRLDRRLQGRIDPSDVVQDALIEASQQLAEYAKDPSIPFFLWLRLITGQTMVALHRHHLGTRARDASREISIFGGALPEASSAAIAVKLLGHETRPSEAAMRAERALQLQGALSRMDALDREVLTLRHFEQLSNAEIAQVLGIGESAASKRYVRALQKLREILETLSAG